MSVAWIEILVWGAGKDSETFYLDFQAKEIAASHLRVPYCRFLSGTPVSKGRARGVP